MIRRLVSFALALAVAGCISATHDPLPGAPGGSGGAPATGGAGGSAPATGGAGGTSPSGTGGQSSPTGGTIGGTPDSGGGPMPDGPMSVDAGPVSDGRAGGSDGGYMPGGDIMPGRPYIHLCSPGWDQMKCCEFLCECVANYCADVPQDSTRIGNAACMAMCTKLNFARARCQVFHCFESKSPTAVADHASHCGHATGRVGGGSCANVP